MFYFKNLVFILVIYFFSSCQDHNKNNYNSPIDSLSYLLEKDSSNILFLNERAKLYLNNNQLDVAKKDIDNAYLLFKNDIEILLNRGDIYYALNKTRIAKESWERCLKLNPNELTCRQKLTELLCAVRNPHCKSMIDTLVTMNNGIVSASLIAHLKELREYKFAIELLNKLILQFPKNKDYLSLLSILYSDSASFNQEYNIALAEKYFKKIIELYPDYARVYYNFGKHKQNIFKYKEALTLYNKSLELDPLNKQIYYNIGFCYMQIQDYNEAIQYFSQAIDLDNTFLYAYHARAYLYDLTKATEKAKSDWKQCLMLNPSYIPALEALSK